MGDSSECNWYFLQIIAIIVDNGNCERDVGRQTKHMENSTKSNLDKERARYED